MDDGALGAAAAEAADVLSDEHVGRRVVRGTALRAVAFAGTSVLAAVGSIFLLRHLGVVDFGRYGTVMALVAIVAGVTDAGLTITGSRELALRPPGPERSALLANLIALRFALTLAGVVVAVGFASLAGYGHDQVEGTALAGIGVVLQSSQAAAVLPLAVELRNGRLALNELLKTAVLVAGFIALSVAGAGIVPLLGMQIVAGIVLLAITPALVGRAGLVRPRWESAQWRPLVVAALPIAVSSVLTIVYLRVLVVITSLIADDRQTGLFVTSSRIYELMSGFPLLLTGVALPVVTVAARDNPARVIYVMQRMTEVAALAGTLVAITLGVAARPIIVLLGGSQFGDAGPVFRIQVIAALTIFLLAAWSTVLIAMGRQRAVAICTASGLVAVVVLGLVFIPLFDARGAALAASVADALLAATIYVALRKAGPGRELQLGFLRRLVPLAAVATAIVLVPGIPALLAAALAGIVFMAGALWLRLVPAELLHALPGRARSGS